MTIKVDHVSKRFKGKKNATVQAVGDVSFTAESGKIFGLLGLNGAGKTTLLRMICTVLQPDSGSISVCGFDAAKQPAEVRSKIGFLPADSGLYSYDTPRETLRFFGRLCKYPGDLLEARIEELITLFNMEDFGDKLCKGLSSGMKQKVCFARAIIHDPDVIIFDEPTNNLDIVTRVAVHDYIRKCRDDGKCVILSTHIMSEAEKLCDELAIMHKGQLLALGSPDSLRQQTGQQFLEDVFINYIREPSHAL